MPAQKMKLSSQALEIHQQLKKQVIEKIKQCGGVLRFADFMQAALYSPRLGYYQNALQTFGEAGDFITAPEMGDLFGHCVADSLTELLTDNHRSLLEIGAGSGALARAVLARLADNNCLPEHYQILEPSGVLQQLQRTSLSAFDNLRSPSIEWLAELPNEFNGTIIANEIIDALPCERIQKTAEGWQYLGVSFDGESFLWQPAGTVDKSDLPETLHHNEAYVEGYTTEVRPLLRGWIKSLAASLNSGRILLFDYGYPQAEFYHPQRTQGSMRCFSRHQLNNDPLSLIGLQDITAHVDFSEVARAATVAGLEVVGFTTQAGFLIENGVLEQVQNNSMKDSSMKDQIKISQQMQKLMAPGQMGELVKVIQLTKNTDRYLRGFSMQDHLYRL